MGQVTHLHCTVRDIGDRTVSKKLEYNNLPLKSVKNAENHLKSLVVSSGSLFTFDKCTQTGSDLVHTFSAACLVILCAFLKSKQTTL